MMVTVIADDLSVCVDCALLCASGQVTDSDGNDITEAHADKVAAIWPGHVALVLDSVNDEPFHSKYACDGCGDTDAGDRMKAAVLGE